MTIGRREFLAGTAILVLSTMKSRATIISGGLPWTPDAGIAADPGQARPVALFHLAMKAAPSRRWPTASFRPIRRRPAARTPAAPSSSTASSPAPMAAPKAFTTSRPSCPAPSSRVRSPRKGRPAIYREALAALDRYCQSTYQGKRFADLSDEQKDELLNGLENEKIKLEGVDGKSFFAQVIKDVQNGFFADPIYGGNRDMVAWKMIGFPGARYNYLDWVDRHNERYPLPPVSMTGRADWTPKP